jgi:uncharacterized protein YqfA (UPF0365 family)
MSRVKSALGLAGLAAIALLGLTASTVAPAMAADGTSAMPLLDGPDIMTVAIGIVVLIVIVVGFFAAQFAGLWIQAYTSRASISLAHLVMMRLRKVNPKIVVEARIMAIQAGLDVQPKAIEAHILARGDSLRVVRALIAANRAKIDLQWQTAAAIDLAGRDVLDAVRTSVNPRVIDCPDPAKGRQTIDAVAMDGIQLRVKARVTVRSKIERLVGGATEETIIARVGEGIVTTIGSAITHKKVLENPDMISKSVLNKSLDAQTAFVILSIDIADIDVGENIGAKLQADQAEADKRVAQARAEERRAMAIALQAENKALIEENRAKLVLAEAEIPKAFATALREGNIGVMDYYRLKNIQADTDMRRSIGGEPGSGAGNPKT